MKRHRTTLFLGGIIITMVQALAGTGAGAAGLTALPDTSGDASGSGMMLQPVPSVLSVPKVSYSLCHPGETGAEPQTRATPLNYFTYIDVTYFDLQRNFEQTNPAVGFVRQQSGSGTTDCLAAKSSHLWYWGYLGGASWKSESGFPATGLPQLRVLCDTPQSRNSWVKFNGVYQSEQYPAYKVYDRSTGEFLESSLCAFEYNHQLITGVVVEKNQGVYSNLNVPYLCAAINVFRAYPGQVIIYTEPAGWARSADPDAFIPLHAEVDYLLAETSASEPEEPSACHSIMNWTFPETGIPVSYTTSLSDIQASYPPDDSIRYCMGYTTDSRNNLIKTLGLERGKFFYLLDSQEEQEHYILAGGCYFPGASGQRPLPFLAAGQSPGDLWTARYRSVSVPVNAGWGDYDLVQNPGTKAGCQGGEGNSEPAYFCRFTHPEDITSYVYGVFTPGAGSECKAITLHLGEDPEYGFAASSDFQVYTRPVDNILPVPVTASSGVLPIKATPAVEMMKPKPVTLVSGADIVAISLPAGLMSLMLASVIPGL